MDLQVVTKLCNSLEPIRKQLELLEFWCKWPEIKSIKVDHMYEHDRRGGLSSCHYMNGIEFISFEAKRELTLRCFLTDELGEKDFIDVDPSDWDEILEFTSLNCLENENKTYIRPDEVEKEIKVLEAKAQAFILEHLKGTYVYPIVTPGWNIVEDKSYLGTPQVFEIYTDYTKAEQAVIKQNLTRAVHIDIDEIYEHGRPGLKNPDNYDSVEEKLNYWKEHAPEFLSEVVRAVVQ